MKRAWFLLALAACHTPRNAPGNVDLAAAPAFERGDPATFELPSDPGENVLGIAPAVWVMGGSAGDLPGGAMEGGAQVTVAFGERETSGRKLAFPIDSWGGTVGWAFVQGPGDEYQSYPARTGPVSAEVSRLWHFTMTSVGMAAMPTASGVHLGGQATFQAAVFAVRVRVIEGQGVDVFAGYQVPLPFSVSWSR